MQARIYKHEKGREKSKGKGKGKDRSQSRSRSLTPGSRKETCKFWKAGHCHRGKDCAFQHPEKTVPAKKEDRKKKKKKEKKPRKRSSSRGSSGSDNSTGSESQRRKGGKSSSSTAPAAVCLLRAVVMAAVVSQGSSVLITRPLGSVATPVLSASNTIAQTTLKGKPTWIRIPKYRWPKSWHGKYKDPAIPLVLALYGHPDSGLANCFSHQPQPAACEQ